jgi:hypothetical protein
LASQHRRLAAPHGNRTSLSGWRLRLTRELCKVSEITTVIRLPGGSRYDSWWTVFPRMCALATDSKRLSGPSQGTHRVHDSA